MHKNQPGISLIETLLFVLIVLAITTILLTTAGSFSKTLGVSLNTRAAKIASREIETLRNTPFASLPGSGAITDPELAKLPSGTATRTVVDYGSPPDPDIKLVTVTINWTESGGTKNVVFDTLIYKYGL